MCGPPLLTLQVAATAGRAEEMEQAGIGQVGGAKRSEDVRPPQLQEELCSHTDHSTSLAYHSLRWLSALP